MRFLRGVSSFLRRPPVWLAAATLLAPLHGAAQPQPGSASFLLSQDTLNNGGGDASSPTFLLNGSLGQKGVVGESVSPTLQLQSGFWTNLSTLAVLRVAGFGSGQGSVEGTAIACTLAPSTAMGACRETAVHGTDFSLLATPAPMNRFDGWTGCDGTTTTNTAGDTCLISLNASRTVTAGFTLLGDVSGRLWRDVDADGVKDLGEPGLDGVTLRLTQGTSFAETAVTGGGGFYYFADAPPGDLTLSVEPSTLPPGMFPSYDPDGAATPHTTQLDLDDGASVSGLDFGYQPLIDLSLSLTPTGQIPSSGGLTYVVEVINLGPATATGVAVTAGIDDRLRLVRTQGCPEDPTALPVCSLGTLEPGELTTYTIEVVSRRVPDPGPPLVAEASVSAVEVDPVAENDSASAAVEPFAMNIPVGSPVGLALLSLLLACVGWSWVRRLG